MEQLTPLTREEEILNTLLSAAGGGSVADLSPETRKEQWYQNALDAINGNELTYDLAAQWRSEQWYAKLIEALQEGGGSVPEYEGSYSVTPSESVQTLATKDKKCTDDISVGAISSTYIGSGVTQKAAATYTPTTSDQTIAANQYLAGAQTVEGVVCENLTAGNIKKDVVVKVGTASDDDSVATVTGTYEGGGGGSDPWDEEPPNDGKTRLYVELTDEYKTPVMKLSMSGTAHIDWGDNSAQDTLSGSGTKSITHSYQSGGKYIITIDVESGGKARIYGPNLGNYPWRPDSTSYLFFADQAVSQYSNAANANTCYAYAVKKIYVGSNIVAGDSAFANLGGLTKLQFDSPLELPKSATNATYTPFLFDGCVNLTDIDLTKTNINCLSRNMFANVFRLSRLVIPSSVTFQVESQIFTNVMVKEMKFLSETPVALSSGYLTVNGCIYYVPFSALAAYLTATNYPAPATYTYIGFATYENGVTLPTQDATEAYNVVWYATKADAIAQTNAITVGNGNEVYCRYTAVS